MTADFSLYEEMPLLAASLAISVPPLIGHLEETSAEDRVILGKWEARVVAEHGDALQYRVKGWTRRAHLALARCLAIAAYQPGGITFAGLHWCTDHAACLAVRAL